MRFSRLMAIPILLGALAVSSRAEVVRTEESGAPRLTVRAKNALAVDLIREVAVLTDRVLLLAEDLPDGDPLTLIDLRDRPLDEIVEILAGVAGYVGTIRASSISLNPEPVVPEPRDLRVRGLASHTRGIVAHPRRPEVVRARMSMAKLNIRLGQPGSAVDELLRAADALADRETGGTTEETLAIAREISIRLGEAYASLEQWERVVRHQAALSIEPDCPPEVLLRLGIAFAALGSREAAREHLARVTSKGSGAQRLEARLALGELERGAKRDESALAHLVLAGRSERASVGGTALLSLAELHAARKEHAEAARCLAVLRERFSTDSRIVEVSLALVELAAGPLRDPLRAVTLLDETLAMHPDCMTSTEAVTRTARLWARVGIVDRARERLEREIDRLADDDPARADLLVVLARLLEDALLPERARVAYRRLAVLPGHEYGARLRAARCLLRIAESAPTPNAQRRELLACLEETRAISPDDLSEEHRALRLEIESACLTLLGDQEGARRAMEEAVR